jgi:hypothetical protein
MVIAPACHATWACGIYSLESIPELLESLKIPALLARDDANAFPPSTLFHGLEFLYPYTISPPFPRRQAWLGIKAAKSWQDFPARSGEKLDSREGKIGRKIVTYF